MAEDIQRTCNEQLQAKTQDSRLRLRLPAKDLVKLLHGPVLRLLLGQHLPVKDLDAPNNDRLHAAGDLLLHGLLADAKHQLRLVGDELLPRLIPLQVFRVQGVDVVVGVR